MAPAPLEVEQPQQHQQQQPQASGRRWPLALAGALVVVALLRTAAPAAVTQKKYVCAIEDSVEFDGVRGGQFITTAFPVSRCNVGSCSVLNVIGEPGAPEHLSERFSAVRALSSGQEQEDGRWCLCREAQTSRLLVSFGGVSSAKPCEATQCYQEYVRTVERFILDATPGTTGLSSLEWQAHPDPQSDAWTRRCCAAEDEDCPMPHSEIAPFRVLAAQLQRQPLSPERQAQLEEAEAEQVPDGCDPGQVACETVCDFPAAKCGDRRNAEAECGCDDEILA